jgi:hypothetical protein
MSDALRYASLRRIKDPGADRPRPARRSVDAVLPNRTVEAVGIALDGVLAKDDVLLCVDGDAAVIAYVKKHGIEFNYDRAVIIALRLSELTEGCDEVQTQNSSTAEPSRGVVPKRPLGPVSTTLKHLRVFRGNDIAGAAMKTVCWCRPPVLGGASGGKRSSLRNSYLMVLCSAGALQARVIDASPKGLVFI